MRNSNKQVDLSQGFTQADRVALSTWLISQQGLRWQPLQEFSRRWNDHSDSIHQGIAEVGLEFDLPESSIGPPPLPSLFIKPKLNQSLPKSPAGLMHLLSNLCPVFMTKAFTDELLTSISLLLKRLPSDSGINHIGIMSGRETNTLRLHIRGMSFSAINALINSMQRCQTNQRFSEILEQASTEFDQAVLCLDFSPRLSPTFAIELFTGNLFAETNLNSALGKFVEMGICDSQIHQAIVQWPGVSDPGPLLGEWRKELDKCDEEPGKKIITLRRSVTHLKLALDKHNEIYGKAYLEFNRKTAMLKQAAS